MKTTRRGFFATVCALFVGRKAAPEIWYPMPVIYPRIAPTLPTLTFSSARTLFNPEQNIAAQFDQTRLARLFKPEPGTTFYTPAEYNALFHKRLMEIYNRRRHHMIPTSAKF